MNVLYTVNDAYAPQAAAGVVSICVNNQDAPEICFFILTHELSQDNEAKLVGLAEEYGRLLRVIRIENFLEKFGSFDTGAWNEIVLARLMIGRFLPPDVERVLYLDGDTIVRGSLKSLWCLPFSEEEILGGVIEPTIDRNRIADLGLRDVPYCNAGVLLVDLEKWRAFNPEPKFLKCIERYGELLVANDQDVLNIVFKDHIKLLDPGYNFCNTYFFYPYRVLRKITQGSYFYSEQQCADGLANPTIVHYLGEERPWRKGSTHRYRGDYEHYLSLTPFADAPQELGWELYFKVWALFNAIMKPMPMLRYRIINGLIPSFLKFRSIKRKRY